MSHHPHYRNGRFHNRYPHEKHDVVKFLQWLPDYLKLRNQTAQFPLLKPDVSFLKGNRSDSTLTWIGHSSFLIQIGGVNVITDPHLTARASPFGFAGPLRMMPPAMDFPDLPALDLALISHNHYDHLDEGTVRRLAAEHPRLNFIVPLGLKSWFMRRRIRNVTELDWWRETSVAGGRVTAVPAQHFSGRSATDRNKTLWCGFVFESAGRKIYFAGDTGYSRDFLDIAERFAPVDLAMIPIGAYQPRWFMRSVHVDPVEAVKIHQDLRSRQSVGMHWGTFQLTEEPPDQPPRKLAEALRDAGVGAESFWVFRHGETRHF